MDTKKLNVAVVIGSDLQSGGGYQYEFMVLDILKKFHRDESIQFKFYGFNDSVKKDYADFDLDIKVIKENVFHKIHRQSLSNLLLYELFKGVKLKFSHIEKELDKDKIDLVYFLSPTSISHALINIPYVFTLWDLGHLDVSEFPEVSHNREFERRECLYTKSLKKAFKIIVDLEYGKINAIRNYNLDEKKIEVLKFLPNIRVINNIEFIDIKKKYGVSSDYIYYPAQFWAHKNHIYILKALKYLRESKGIDIHVLFSGSDKGNLDYIISKSKNFKVDDLVHYIGFVANEEIPFLYQQSLSLVMPTYLGPTNIPPLEAFAYNTTVCYSDTPYFREQVGDAAFFMNLNDPLSLAGLLVKILSNDPQVGIKKELGLKILEDWSDNLFYSKLLGIFKEYQYIRETWL